MVWSVLRLAAGVSGRRPGNRQGTDHVRESVLGTTNNGGEPPERYEAGGGPKEEGSPDRTGVVVALVVGLVLVAGMCISIGMASRRGVAGGHRSHRTDVAVQQLTPVNRRTWWVVLEGQTVEREWILRTVDGGRHWRDVSPPVPLVGSSDFLDAEIGWVVPAAQRTPVGTALSSLVEPVYATVDGGATWRRLGSVPYGCYIYFVDRSHGWCTALGAAAGSEGVQLVGTVDGGRTWHPVSTTAVYPAPSTPGALPFGCDKELSFATQTIGLATEACNGGEPVLYRSTDGGATWTAVHLPLPPGFVPPYGDGFFAGSPVFDGSQVTMAVEYGVPTSTSQPTWRVAVYRSDDRGTTWRVVPLPHRFGPTPVVVDATHWFISDGATLAATADGGRHWRTWRPDVALRDHLGQPMRLQFLTPLVGWALSSDADLLMTTDGGHSWRALAIDPGRFSFAVAPLPKAAPKPA